MKRCIMAVVLALLCAASGLAQSRGRRGRQPAASAGEQQLVDIQQVDFRNYAYLVNGRTYKLINGSYAEALAPNSQWVVDMVDGPYFGDLTGDQQAEVAFVLSYGPITGPKTSEARIYSLENGRPVLIATFLVARAINCRLDSFLKIEDGMIEVERILSNGTNCDHDEVTEYHWEKGNFTPVGSPRRLPCRCM